ncbi:hypothetical protein [Formosa sp. S-31]|uniref:hypothetical protein n=1 Tax=Formosa sp. S-31 TaxID=2790949 RepID=UPI003EB787CD
MLYKTIILVALMSLQPLKDCPGMTEVRAAFQVLASEADLQHLFDVLKQVNCEEKTPFLAVATMRQAHFTSWPFKKMSYFKEGKTMLENYIKLHPDSIDARYVRYLSQRCMPSFLNYHDNLEEDKSFILNHIKSAQLPEDYKSTILKTISEN